MNWLSRLRALRTLWLRRCEYTGCNRPGSEMLIYELTDLKLGHGTTFIRYCPEHYREMLGREKPGSS